MRTLGEELHDAGHHPGLLRSASALVSSMLVRRRAPVAAMPEKQPSAPASVSTCSARVISSVASVMTHEDLFEVQWANSLLMVRVRE